MSERSRKGQGPRSFRGVHVAEIERRGRFTTAVPLFEPGPQISLGRDSRELEGRIALIEFGAGKGRVLRELGSAATARDVAAALLWERGRGRAFGRDLERQAADVAASVAADPGARRELTELATFTVDPASARDFDDAVSAQREGDGARLWIHIADVAAHVAPGSDLDREALERANSTYVPGTVEPMLPAVLSDDACSLAPGVERLAVTSEIELGPGGEVRSARFYRSRIRSDARLDYDRLDRVFAGREAAPGSVAAPLEAARAVAAALGKARGAGLTVDSREPEFLFDEAGDVLSARGVEQTEAHRLIERLMILANGQVASLLEQKRAPALYRVHEQPDPQRIEFMVSQLASLDLPTPALPARIAPQEAGRLAAEASRMVAAEAERRGHGRSAYTSLVLRALKQAHYSDRNLGHAGLASDAYCHFTSPIRRYPDLIAHRALLSLLGEGESVPSRGAVADAAVHCSERERDSARIERDADDVCAAFLLERELLGSGWDTAFGGEVSGVIGAGAFIAFGGELGDVYEGFLPARKLRGERFELSREETALEGTRSGRRLRLGDPIAVRAVGIESARGRVDLEPVEG